jgi:hypothetical protein
MTQAGDEEMLVAVAWLGTHQEPAAYESLLVEASQLRTSRYMYVQDEV